MKGICQSGSQLHHYFPFFASGAKRQATRLCSAALLLPSSSSLRSDSGGGGVQSDKFSSNPLSPSTGRSSFLRPQPCGRSTLGRDEGGRPVLEGGLFREGIFSQNSCQEVGERAVELRVQGPDKTARGDLPLPPPEAKAGKMQSRGKWEESFQRPRRVYVRIRNVTKSFQVQSNCRKMLCIQRLSLLYQNSGSTSARSLVSIL